jgi:uncharacterized damage-inducible protein DinB
MKDDLFSLYGYNRWANERVIESLRALPPADYTREMGGGWPSPRATFVHLATATDAWAERFGGRVVTTARPETDLPEVDDAVAILFAAEDKLDTFLASLTPERMSKPFTWKNVRNETKTSVLWAVLRHVVNHQTYHRGQISSMLRRLGATPKSTDLVRWGIEMYERGIS